MKRFQVDGFSLTLLHAVLTVIVSTNGTLFHNANGFVPTIIVLEKSSTQLRTDTAGYVCDDKIRRVRLKFFKSNCSNNLYIYQRKLDPKLYSYIPGNDSDHDIPMEDGYDDRNNNNDNNEQPMGAKNNHRRTVLSKLLHSFATSMITSSVVLSSTIVSIAAITDETDTFADNWWTTPSTSSSQADGPNPKQQQNNNNGNTEDTDIVSIKVSKSELIKEGGGLGIELADIEFRTNVRVFVKSIQSNSYGSKLGIQPNWVVVSIDNQSMERTNSKGVATFLRQAILSSSSSSTSRSSDTITIRFRDPSVFRTKLQTFNANNNESNPTTTVVTTQVAPAGDTSIYNRDGTKILRTSYLESDQKIRVSQLIAPPTPRASTGSLALCTKQATVDDLLEISYTGTVVETGYIFDGSAIKINGNGIPGRGDDVTLYFVLGKQPYGQFPPGWDVGLIGTCVGERRRILVPPALGYGPNGLPRRNIPPNATLQYDVTLVSLNGVSTIQ